MNANRIWAIGTILAIAGILGLGWLVGVSPLLSQATEADQQRVGVEQTNQVAQAVLEGMKEDHDRLPELEAELASLKLSIPTEVDSDFVYAYLAGIQSGVGVTVEKVTTGEAQPYGVPTAADGGGSEVPAGAASVPDFYTVPVTITFPEGTSATEIVAFAGALQNGPRIFLVTSIARPSTAESEPTITAYMFVMSVPDDSPGSSEGEHAEALLDVAIPVIKEWDWRAKSPDDEATPGATPTPTPGTTDSATPTPTPTSTTGP